MLDWLRTWRIPGLGWTPLGTLAFAVVYVVGVGAFILTVGQIGDWLVIYRGWPDWTAFAVGGPLLGIYMIGGGAWLAGVLRRWHGARRSRMPSPPPVPVPVIDHASATTAALRDDRRLPNPIIGMLFSGVFAILGAAYVVLVIPANIAMLVFRPDSAPPLLFWPFAAVIVWIWATLFLLPFVRGLRVALHRHNTRTQAARNRRLERHS